MVLNQKRTTLCNTKHDYLDHNPLNVFAARSSCVEIYVEAAVKSVVESIKKNKSVTSVLCDFACLLPIGWRREQKMRTGSPEMTDILPFFLAILTIELIKMIFCVCRIRRNEWKIRMCSSIFGGSWSDFYALVHSVNDFNVVFSASVTSFRLRDKIWPMLTCFHRRIASVPKLRGECFQTNR